MNAIEEAKKIAALLNEETYAYGLWDILSALRGPDSKNYKAKLATTAVIRHTLGISKALLDSGPDTVEYARYRTRLIPMDHFGSHARRAFQALGLKWDEVNK